MRGDDTYNFGMSDSPMMEGTWYNPTTGDSFTVRDSYFEGDNYYVIATDGRRFDANMIERYVRSDKPISAKPAVSPTQPVTKQPDNTTNSILTADLDENLQSDIDVLLQPVKSTSTYPTQKTEQDIVKSIDLKTEDEKLADRVLGRTAMPDIDVKTKWSKFPKKQIDCLVDMMGVGVDVIVNYYIDKMDLNFIRESIKTQLTSLIEDSLDEVTPIVTPEKIEVKIKESKTNPKKLTVKTTKKK